MAHSLQNNLRGRAAVTHRAEVRDQILSVGEKVDINSLRARLKRKETDAIARCLALEEKKSFYAWYASVDGSISTRVEMIENRISDLEDEARYTIVDRLVGEENANIVKIVDVAESVPLDI